MVSQQDLIKLLVDREVTGSEKKCLSVIHEVGLVEVQTEVSVHHPELHHGNLINFIRKISSTVEQHGQYQLAQTLCEVIAQSTLDTDFGGYGLNENEPLNTEQEGNVIFLCGALLDALKFQLRLQSTPQPIDYRPEGRRGMTMSEKIFAMHDTSRKGWVRPGDVIQVDVDWVLASELSWGGIEKTYDALGRPGIFRNDRFWLAGDHRVEPPLYNEPAVKRLMDSCRTAQKEMKMTDFQGFNYTIMHTEFVRERAQPGMLCIGADSHTCSAGAVSCLSIGLGGTDVAMPLITGQTWFNVPETVSLRLINAPPKGIGGKDTILYILQQFKRNTIAADRVVEFGGPGLKHLSCDARFAIANMCTEFGAVTGIFESDEQTSAFINRRYQKKHKDKSVYFRADADAVYAEQHTIDLSKVESFVAVYPSPDNVVSVTEAVGKKLDGCFIGACTTAEEDLIIGAMVLEAGLEKGWRAVKSGRRRVVPGSRPITNKLERLGFLDIYRKAGFKIGVPGCSMCVGQGTDQAQAGEVWLSSQNRNFKNRMGPGSIANLSSAATVAASSVNMQITNPRELLDEIDLDRLKDVLGRRPIDHELCQDPVDIQYKEPYGAEQDDPIADVSDAVSHTSREDDTSENTTHGELSEKISGRALVLGDFIDTDAIIPSKFITAKSTMSELGPHCMEFFMPSFRTMVGSGQSIIVAGKGFGVGSSRDVAVPALQGAGIKAVIAKSFAFIYARNQPNLGLLGVVIEDERFYELATDGVRIDIDLRTSKVICEGQKFGFILSEMEKRLIAAGGITEAFRRYGKSIFDELCRPKGAVKKSETIKDLEEVLSY